MATGLVRRDREPACPVPEVVALVALVAIAAVGAACGGSTGAAQDASPTSNPPYPPPRTWSFGEPADPSEASRTLEIEALDSFRFEPDVVRAERGEVVTFRVRNAGSVGHQFVIGTEADQTDAEVRAQRAPVQDWPDDPDAVRLEAGETADLTWRFPHSSTAPVFFACHAPGHFQSGMKGRVRIGSDR